ncbi:MAG: hypothetical protein ACMUFK_02575 [Thermoplasmatota archaeon]
MGIRKVIKSGLGRSNPYGIYLMAENVDVAGLIDNLDRVNYDLVPLVFQYLTYLSDLGWFDRIISYGVIPKAVKAMEMGSLNKKKSAMYLLYSLITHGRGDIVLANDGVIENMLKLLDGEEEGEIRKGVAYCLSVLCTMGASEIIVRNGGIERISQLVGSDDELTVSYALFILNSISSMGYQREILNTKVNQNIRYHNPGNPDIERLSQMLLDDLYSWREEDFILSMDELEVIDDTYLRPSLNKHRIESRDGTILGYDGKKIMGRDEREVVVELKRRRLERSEQSKDFNQKPVDDADKSREESKPLPVSEERRKVKQRVVKKRKEAPVHVEREVVNVISGSLDEIKDGNDSIFNGMTVSIASIDVEGDPNVQQGANKPEK